MFKFLIDFFFIFSIQSIGSMPMGKKTASSSLSVIDNTMTTIIISDAEAAAKLQKNPKAK